MTYTVRAPARARPSLLDRRQRDHQALLTVPGVGGQPQGGVDREIASPKPERLMRASPRPSEQQLQRDQRRPAGGKAKLGAAAEHPHGRQRHDARRAAHSQIALHDGRSMRLSDLARSPRLRRAVAGRVRRRRRVVAFQVIRAVGSSAVDVGKRSTACAPARQPASEIAALSSTVETTKESYDASIEALVMGALLAVLVVLLFLRDWRATLISAHRDAAVA